jgi:hypothetical protein
MSKALRERYNVPTSVIALNALHDTNWYGAKCKNITTYISKVNN